MKNLLFASIIVSVSLVSAHGQTSAYRVDNFDLGSGIRIEAPAVAATKRAGGRMKAAHATTINLSSSLSGFTTGDTSVDNFIIESGHRNLVDPLLLYAIMHQESTFKPRAMSNKGARGLMQLMPGTAARFGVSSIWDPKQNIEGGARYMRFLLDQFDGDVKLALAGYNAGEGAVMKYGNRIPPYSETQEYVRRISRRYELIRDPLAARSANILSGQQLATARSKEPIPLNIYERTVFAVKLPDGRLQLITQ
ncbi:MAG TPA: lytic transglycosylase domain-containing protein [Pyrinomonadaceae bacterium]|nr:lytic transglycosylase domain-containing protein [Pyrinomonadaceae bacterium]